MAIRFQQIKYEGGWLSCQPLPEDRGLAMALVRKHKDRLYDLEVKEHREKRSLDANAYCWVLCGKLAEKMKLKPLDVYRNAIRDLGGNYTPVCIPEKDMARFVESWTSNGLGWLCDDAGPNSVAGCRTILAYHGSSSYDSKTMARLIDNLVADCKALDIETLPPQKLAAMKGEWK